MYCHSLEIAPLWLRCPQASRRRLQTMLCHVSAGWRRSALISLGDLTSLVAICHTCLSGGLSVQTVSRKEQETSIVARILVIDDEDQPRQMLQQALERAGYEVTTARDGSEGLQRFRAAPTDLVITDILMPEKEGLETIMDLRREFPTVKIIAVSGGGRTGGLNFLDIAERLGAQRTLQKPFGLREMLAAVHELLQD